VKVIATRVEGLIEARGFHDARRCAARQHRKTVLNLPQPAKRFTCLDRQRARATANQPRRETVREEKRIFVGERRRLPTLQNLAQRRGVTDSEFIRIARR